MRRAVSSLALLLALCPFAQASPRLDLAGFQDREGAITVQHGADTVDPYFALQALLLAQRHGLDATEAAQRWIAWLLPRQKPDATFDRFCRSGAAWAPCKTADADDSLLALWMQLLESMPGGFKADPARAASHAASGRALERLFMPSWGVYHASPVYLHALFMDNLEVWSRLPARSEAARALERGIQSTFWDPASQRYRVTTQLAARGDAFYPDAVAQIYPLYLDFPAAPRERSRHYRDWMRQHGARWLAQGKDDFAWGLVAVVAWREGDRRATGCWMREAQALRRGPHWTVTDEVAYQVLEAKGAAPAAGACA
ncbi:MAG TPA: hypothetical protein VM122_02925 [Usitatibacter sp.]|nr:hypothetical protein [Usitatibacter sp.]